MPKHTNAPNSVLVVCLGNICRSPTAEEVLRQKAAVAGLATKVDSAGTGNWHIGKHPDERSQRHAKQHGYNISKLTARQVTQQDFEQFDLILAMDNQNLQDLKAMQANLPNTTAKLALFTEECPLHGGQDVPDPYYGDDEDFERVIDYIESAADAWISCWTGV